MICSYILYLLFLSVSSQVPSKRFTPALGWNSWNAYHCSINEKIILQNAQAIVDLGLKELGYIYVNIDDCWQASRNATNHIQPNKINFPNGIGYISDKIHAMGLKFGIYSSAGTKTCAGLPGSLDYEKEDAESYKEWNVDYLKYDNCYNKGRVGMINSYYRYRNMSQELMNTGRDIVFSLCSWGEDFVEDWADGVGNSFRNSDDIYDSYYSMLQILTVSIPMLPKIKPGCWADLDMLEVGNGGMTFEEYKSHFSLWALLKSPLILGNKLDQVNKETLSIISNKDIIDINQDQLGLPVQRRYLKNYRVQLYSGRVKGGWVMLLFNTADKTVSVPITWSDVFADENHPLRFSLKDLWSKEISMVDLTRSNDWYSVVSHGVLVYKIIADGGEERDNEKAMDNDEL